MSHVVVGEVQFKNLTYLARACRALGLEYTQSQVEWRWYGRWVNDYHGDDAAYKHGIPPSEYGKATAGVIKIPGCKYDIGVYKLGDNFVAIYDTYGPGQQIVKRFGSRLEKLMQQYAYEVAHDTLTRKGYKVNTVRQGNKIKLVARR